MHPDEGTRRTTGRARRGHPAVPPSLATRRTRALRPRWPASFALLPGLVTEPCGSAFFRRLRGDGPITACRYDVSLPGAGRRDGVQGVQGEAEVDEVVGGEGGSSADLERLGRHVERLD